MNIIVACVGTIKEKFYADAINEYLKRLTKFHNVNIIEVKEGKIPKNPSAQDIERVKDSESKLLQQVCKGYVVLLDINGQNITSEELSQKIEKISLSYSTLTFAIGGSYGVTNAFKQGVDFKLSYSKQTFPHQLMRVILMESLYRSATISHNITYHK